MCGIVGALCLAESGFRVHDAYLARMRDTMIHRGPNGGANWISPDGKIGLGHRRLSIIDLSSVANQPMCNEDGTLWVVFNGEIYNHAEIRAELESRGGHRWRTHHSDTEVILHAFEEWGIECLQKFRGMFAIALWDAKKRELWLIRDRIGIKPLYYSRHHGRLTFASEIKALLADPDQPRQVNEEGLFHYLTFLAAPAPQTLFDGIHKLPPATWMRIRADGSVLEQRYWDVWDHTSPLTKADENELAERVLAELRTAVRLRKVSDVPVGVFLSGGIDSSTNAALFSEGEHAPVKTFTIGYQGHYQSYKNETDYARLMASKVGADHHELLLSVDDLLAFLPRMVDLQDEPIGDPVCVPVYYVSKLARDHGVIVCQVGEGADELFCGYPTWKIKLHLARMNEWPVPPALKSGLLAGMGVSGLSATPAYEALRRAVTGRPIFWGGVDAFTRPEKLRLLSPRLRDRFAQLTSWEPLKPIYQRFRENAWDQSHLNWMTYLDLNLRLPELLLMRVDKMSMGVSLEGRVPLLYHKFVELAMSIPSAMKTRHGQLKYLLKKAVRGVIPDELIDRKKQGFAVPVYEWVYDKLGAAMETSLYDFCRQTDFLDWNAVQSCLRAGKGSKCWYLLNLALWWQRFIAGADIAPPAAHSKAA
jgi:asparagine synthase (glutamine-hydrolysing)